MRAKTDKVLSFFCVITSITSLQLWFPKPVCACKTERNVTLTVHTHFRLQQPVYSLGQVDPVRSGVRSMVDRLDNCVVAGLVQLSSAELSPDSYWRRRWLFL